MCLIYNTKEQTFSSPSSFRLMTSRSKSVLKPLVRLKLILPVRPSQCAWREKRRVRVGKQKPLSLHNKRKWLQSCNPCFWQCDLHSYPGVSRALQDRTLLLVLFFTLTVLQCCDEIQSGMKLGVMRKYLRSSHTNHRMKTGHKDLNF